ncbi:MAG TPA: hypothetical protein VFM02_00950 [Candidatus Paceibacterota bacterium]|nr:hypothetical protein [Candidatus Paceibacterota bacterium]
MNFKLQAIRGIKKWRIILIILLLLCFLYFAFTYRTWEARVFAGKVLWTVRSDELMYQVPTQKSLSETTFPNTQTLTFKNITFQIPWKTYKIRGSEGQGYVAINFQKDDEWKSGDPSVMVSTETPWYDSMKSHPQTAQMYQEAFPGITLNNYEFYKQTLFVTPGDIHLFTGNPKDYVPRANMLLLKKFFAPASPLYFYENQNGIRGFEFTSSGYIVSEFFTPDDQPYEIMIGHATPKEADAILGSLSAH